MNLNGYGAETRNNVEVFVDTAKVTHRAQSTLIRENFIPAI